MKQAVVNTNTFQLCPTNGVLAAALMSVRQGGRFGMLPQIGEGFEGHSIPKTDTRYAASWPKQEVSLR